VCAPGTAFIDEAIAKFAETLAILIKRGLPFPPGSGDTCIKIIRRGTMFIRILVAAAVATTVAVGAAPAASASQYKNCTEAHQAGRYDIPKGDPDYWPGGDRDDDGIACES